MRTKSIVTIVMTIVIALMAFTGPASAATVPRQNFLVIFSGTADNPKATVVASGAFAAQGSATEESFQDNSDGSLTTVERFDFAAGSVTVTAVGYATEHLNAQACLDSNSATGTFTFTGTGNLASITGHGTFGERGFFLATRTPTGCTPPLTLHAIVRYAGIIDR